MTDHEAQRVIFGALLEAHAEHLSRSELDRLLGDAIAAHDAVGALRRDGVANVEGSLVFACRAAVRTDQLGL